MEIQNCISTTGKDIYFIPMPNYSIRLTWIEKAKIEEVALRIYRDYPSLTLQENISHGREKIWAIAAANVLFNKPINFSLIRDILDPFNDQSNTPRHDKRRSS